MVTAMVENSKMIDSILTWFRTFVSSGCRLTLSWSVWDIVNYTLRLQKSEGFGPTIKIRWLSARHYQLQFKYLKIAVLSTGYCYLNLKILGKNHHKEWLKNNIHAELRSKKDVKKKDWGIYCSSRSLLGNIR